MRSLAALRMAFKGSQTIARMANLRLTSAAISRQSRHLTAICQNLPQRNPPLKSNFPSVAPRSFSSEATDRTETELKILEVLKDRFPDAEHLDVKEGGQSCGEVFEVFVSTTEFKGLSRVKQHQLVIQHIRSIVKDAHVIRVSSQVPAE